jgi:hypothetical protein
MLPPELSAFVLCRIPTLQPEAQTPSPAGRGQSLLACICTHMAPTVEAQWARPLEWEPVGSREPQSDKVVVA